MTRISSAQQAQRAHPWGIHAAIGLVAITVALVFVAATERHAVFRFPLIDGATYARQADLIAEGQSPTGTDPYWQPPLYPYALALLLKLGVPMASGIRFFQTTALMAGIGILTVMLARPLLGKRAAIVAALAVVFYGPLLFYAGQLLPAAPAALLGTAALLLTWRALSAPTQRHAAAAGVAYGLASLTVANHLLMTALAAFWLWRFADSNEAPRRRHAALTLLAAAFLCILPVTLRNIVVSGQWVPVSTNAGINLYIGNSPASEALQATRPGIDWNRLVTRPFRDGTATNDSQAGRYFMRKAVRFALTDPIAWTANTLRKGLNLLNAREIPRNVDVYAFARHAPVLRVLVWRAGPFAFPFGLVAPLALVGLWRLWRRDDPHTRFLVAASVLYAASIVIFFPASRYLVPIIPFLVVGAVGGVQHLVMLRGGPHAMAVGVLGTGLVLVNLPLRFPTDAVPFDAELLTYTGIACQTRGNHARATELYEAALERAPDHTDTWFHLGVAAREVGNTARAMVCHRTALEMRPDHHRAMQDLAVILHGRGQTERAVALLRDCIALDPGNRKAMRNLAIGLMALGKTEEANTWFERVGLPPVTRKNGGRAATRSR